jgi:hypothetical protein
MSNSVGGTLLRSALSVTTVLQSIYRQEEHSIRGNGNGHTRVHKVTRRPSPGVNNQWCLENEILEIGACSIEVKSHDFFRGKFVTLCRVRVEPSHHFVLLTLRTYHLITLPQKYFCSVTSHSLRLR